MRFVEEAIELAQARGLASSVVDAIKERVYSRPAGAVSREIGQCQVSLELLAKAIAIDLEGEAEREFHRVHTVPKEEWDRRQAAKVELGIASASP